MQLLQTSDEQICYPSLLKDRALVFYGQISRFREADCVPILSENEMSRSSHYLLAADKSRYIISRAILKTLLGTFLQADEKQIEFQYTNTGKPFLQNDPALQFSVSHAGDVFAIAISAGDDIGVDVEHLDREAELSKLQSNVLTSAELNEFHRMDQRYQKEFFINCWTKKEALLKATGEGLTRAMNTLELSSFTQDDRSTETGWFLESFTPMERYTAAVALKGPVKGIEYISIHSSHAVLN